MQIRDGVEVGLATAKRAQLGKGGCVRARRKFALQALWLETLLHFTERRPVMLEFVALLRRHLRHPSLQVVTYEIQHASRLDSVRTKLL